MISLKLLLEEVEQELGGELDESKAAEEAKRQGLEYMSFGRYGKDGKVTHRSQGGKLVPVGDGKKKSAAAKSAKKKASKTKTKKHGPGDVWQDAKGNWKSMSKGLRIGTFGDRKTATAHSKSNAKYGKESARKWQRLDVRMAKYFN